MLKAEDFKACCLASWEDPGGHNAILLAKSMNARLTTVPGGCMIASFDDNSHALLSGNGDAILADWNFEDVAGDGRPTKRKLELVQDTKENG